MYLLENFLTSGHFFPKNTNLIKFRFSLFNSILIIAAFFTFLNYFASLSGFITFTDMYKNILLPYGFINLFIIFLLRKDKNIYFLAVNISLISSLIVFYAALITSPTDEFRLIWFFLVLFASFLLMGKKYGLFFMLFILISIFIINQFFIDIGYSTLALFTFFNSFLIFTAFAYFFLTKIEKDSHEFTLLTDQLKEKVSKEVHQRQEQEDILLQQCRLASMGEMIDSIAHQWRQPLMHINAVLMNMERIIEIQKDPKTLLENKIDEVITLTTHMSQTIEDFRSLLRADKQRVHFYISRSFEQALELYEESLKEIHVTISNRENHTFFGYHNELIQVIIILLSNAIDVLNSRKTPSKYIAINIYLEIHLNISIEDNAGGISHSPIEQIFDPYFTTKARKGGTGLGLYIAKIIIEQNMQGTLRATNTAKGAKFTISLPKN